MKPILICKAIIPLLASGTFTIGRDEDVDLQIDLVSVSRRQLELLSSPDGNELHIKLLSRAKSTINGTVQKLSKGELERTVTYTDAIITIELKCDGPPIKIEREILKLNGKLTLLKDAGVIYQLVPLAEAQFCLPSPSNKVVKYEAMARGVGIVTREWEQYVVANINDVKLWWWDVDYDEFLGVAPDSDRSSLLEGVTAVVYATKLVELLKAMGCAEVIEASGGDDVIALLSDKSPPFVVIDRKISEYPETTTNELYKAIDEVDKSYLHPFELSRKRALPQNSATPASSQTTSTTSQGSLRRKRPRYEKAADKMAFFDIKVEPETEVIEIKDEEVSQPLRIAPETVNDVDTSQTAELSTPGPDTKASTAIPETGDESNGESEDHSVETNRRSKRHIDEVTKEVDDANDSTVTNTTSKRLKFEPKVSLVDAIKQAKLKAEDSIKMEFGETQEEENDLVHEDLANLAIVEVREIPMRLLLDYNTQKLFDERYNGRKNFKKFHKVQQVVPIFRRLFVSVEVVNGHHDVDINYDEGLNQAAEAEEQMEADFSRLFVPEDEDDAGRSTPPPQRQQPTRRQPPARALARALAKPTVVSIDLDSEDDGPRFQFSRS